MGRWEPGSRGRLEQAALELFTERGFETTTVAEIAARAGVTERTFFRHYSDKREVLFSGQAILHDLLIDTVAGSAADAAPLDVVAAAIEAAAAVMQERRPIALQRSAVVAANPSLRERELMKLASLATSMADALRQRGVADPAASLTAEIGIAVFRVAFERWITGPEEDFPTLIRSALAEVRVVAAS